MLHFTHKGRSRLSVLHGIKRTARDKKTWRRKVAANLSPYRRQKKNIIRQKYMENNVWMSKTFLSVGTAKIAKVKLMFENNQINLNVFRFLISKVGFYGIP